MKRDWSRVLLGLARDLESDDEDRLRSSDAQDLRGASVYITELEAELRRLRSARKEPDGI